MGDAVTVRSTDLESTDLRSRFLTGATKSRRTKVRGRYNMEEKIWK